MSLKSSLVWLRTALKSLAHLVLVSILWFCCLVKVKVGILVVFFGNLRCKLLQFQIETGLIVIKYHHLG